ncbi:MAG: nuclear transport factor 2 family protein [Chlamydiales bacterium]|nr:nuclear transport factor 2 family protein [Chlamydiales bacterium]
MFQEMVIKKDASKIPDYYSKEFLMDSNGVTIDYDFLLESHRAIYTTSIEYLIEYQEDTFLQQDDRVAGRMFITTKRPNEAPKRIEVILIVQYLDDKIYRIWELTYPDWSKLPAFESMSSNG